MALGNFCTASYWSDPQIVGAALQVGAAAIVAGFVAWKGDKDRKATLTFGFDQEWNTREMIEGRAAIERRFRTKADRPEPHDPDFASIWQVIMYFGRVAATKRRRHLDGTLFRDLIQRDAGVFAGRMAEKWGIWGATRDDYDALFPGRLPSDLKVRQSETQNLMQ